MPRAAFWHVWMTRATRGTQKRLRLGLTYLRHTLVRISARRLLRLTEIGVALDALLICCSLHGFHSSVQALRTVGCGRHRQCHRNIWAPLDRPRLEIQELKSQLDDSALKIPSSTSSIDLDMSRGRQVSAQILWSVDWVWFMLRTPSPTGSTHELF